jgi:hypothetical protein
MAQSKSTHPGGAEVEIARQILKELRKQLDAAAAGLEAGGADSARAVGRLMGLAYLKTQSVDAYRHAIRLDPSSKRSRAMLVLALMKAGEADEALEQATLLAGEDPSFEIETLLPGETVSALALVGDALVMRGDLGGAEQAYRTALERKGKDTYASGRLTETLLRSSRCASTIQEAIRLGAQTADNFRFADTRAVLRVAAAAPNLAATVACSPDLVPMPTPGRPFVVNGERRRADVERESVWESPLSPNLDGLDASQRQHLGELWAAMGREEHAGVGSFARFVLQLLSLGASADLVQAATQAMRDEIDHAQLCFGVASAALGRSVGVGALDIDGCLDGGSDPWAILEATIVEGCVGETSSAAIAAEARRRCTEGSIAAVLDKIVADESSHADLAWQFSAWMLETHPDLTEQVRAAFSHAAPATGASSDAGADEEWDEALNGFGVVAPRRSQLLVRAAWTDDVLPRAQALLDGANVPAVAVLR